MAVCFRGRVICNHGDPAPPPQANQYYSPNSKCGTLLPEFPMLANLQLKAPFPVDKVRHCYDNHDDSVPLHSVML